MGFTRGLGGVGGSTGGTAVRTGCGFSGDRAKVRSFLASCRCRSRSSSRVPAACRSRTGSRRAEARRRSENCTMHIVFFTHQASLYAGRQDEACPALYATEVGDCDDGNRCVESTCRLSCSGGSCDEGYRCTATTAPGSGLPGNPVCIPDADSDDLSGSGGTRSSSCSGPTTPTTQGTPRMQPQLGDLETPPYCGGGTVGCDKDSCMPAGSACCTRQGFAGRVCAPGSVCTSQGECSTNRGCAGAPVGLKRPCMTEQDCSTGVSALVCSEGTCRQAVAQSFCVDDSWCACASPLRCLGDTCADATPAGSSSGSTWQCGCAYGGGTGSANYICPAGARACGDSGHHCCPGNVPYFGGGLCHADTNTGCHANGNVCPLPCILASAPPYSPSP